MYLCVGCVIMPLYTNFSRRKYEPMANKKCVALTKEQLKNIITTMRSGGAGFRPNEQIATALLLEANLGMRIEDILTLHLQDIVMDGGRYRLNVIEKKTKKKRTFTVPVPVYNFIRVYCADHNIAYDQNMFVVGERQVQKYLQKVVDYLGYDVPIGSHSFRKYFATEIYNKNDHDIVLVQRLLQHSSVATTQRYIDVEQKIDKALQSQCILF